MAAVVVVHRARRHGSTGSACCPNRSYASTMSCTILCRTTSLPSEVTERDVVDVAEDLLDDRQPALLPVLEVDLRRVAVDHGLGSEPDAREEHLHLLRGRVLRLVEDHERIVQRAPRMYASGATSTVPRSISRGRVSAPVISKSAS